MENIAVKPLVQSSEISVWLNLGKAAVCVPSIVQIAPELFHTSLAEDRNMQVCQSNPLLNCGLDGGGVDCNTNSARSWLF